MLPTPTHDREGKIFLLPFCGMRSHFTALPEISLCDKMIAVIVYCHEYHKSIGTQSS
jgi:hypothetical protein